VSAPQRTVPPRPENVRNRQHLVQPTNIEWSEQPTLIGAQDVIAFARDELGVTLTKSMLRHATESRRIQVFKLSARNAYSPAGVVRFIESLARPVEGGAA
jgi:hypothetical protein